MCSLEGIDDDERLDVAEGLESLVASAPVAGFDLSSASERVLLELIEDLSLTRSQMTYLAVVRT